MKKFLIVFAAIALFCACSSEETQQLEEQALNYSLISPDDVRIASNADEINKKITNGKGTVIGIEYMSTNSNSIAAKVSYEIEDVTFETLYISGIEKIQFPKGAIIALGSLKNNGGEHDDYYVSCSGRSCCAPQGYFNTSNNTFVTSCKCEDGNNSQCIMRVSSEAPKLDDN